MSCCGQKSLSVDESGKLSTKNSKPTPKPIAPVPLPPGTQASDYTIPKAIKEQLIRNQQLAKIPKKTE